MLRRFEALTDHDIRNASVIRVFVEDEEITKQLFRVPSAGEGQEHHTGTPEPHVKTELCVVVKTKADESKLKARVQRVLNRFIE